MTATKAPVVFIHGRWLHATAWEPWQDLLAASIIDTLPARPIAGRCLAWLTKYDL